MQDKVLVTVRCLRRTAGEGRSGRRSTDGFPVAVAGRGQREAVDRLLEQRGLGSVDLVIGRFGCRRGSLGRGNGTKGRLGRHGPAQDTPLVFGAGVFGQWSQGAFGHGG